MSDEMNYDYGTSDQNGTNQGGTAQQDAGYGGPVEYGYAQKSSPDPQNAYESADYGTATHYEDPYKNGAEEEPGGMAIASLVLGIIGAVLSCTGWGIVLGILAIIFGAIHLKKRSSRRGMATAGLVLGIIAIVLFVAVVIAIAAGIVSGVLGGVLGGI